MDHPEQHDSPTRHSSSAAVPIVQCADALIALHKRKQWVDVWLAVIIMLPFLGLMEWTQRHVFGLLGMILVALLVIWPRMTRQQRYLRTLRCAYCGRPAGDYHMHHFVLHLQCRHCGRESRTDCQMIGPSEPSKV